MTSRSSLRLFVLRVLVVTLLATLLGRLWFLQIYERASFSQAASANRVRELVTPSSRGEIYDSSGVRLVRNRTALVVSVNRSLLLREPKRRQAAVLDRLAPIVGVPAAEIANKITPCGGTVTAKDGCWRGSPYQPVPVKEFRADEAAGMRRVLRIEEHREEFPGVETGYQAVREYGQKSLAAHVLGYLGPITDEEKKKPQFASYQSDALVGRDGVEASYDAALRGRDGVQRLLVDKDGAVTGEDGATPPTPGANLVLTLDAKVQKVAEDALERAIMRTRQTVSKQGQGILKADSGSVVVMEAKTGRLVAMASYPSYDPTLFVGGISTKDYAALTDKDQGEPLIFRATQGLYAPASTFKVVSTLAALRAGYPLDEAYPCPSVYKPTGQKNFESADLGNISLHEAIVKSCDTIFYKFAFEQWQRDGGVTPTSKPQEVMVDTAKAFGLGTRTGVDLPGEARGTVADRAYKKSYWEGVKADYCTGAKNPAFDEEHRRQDQEYCTDGYMLRGGDATNFAIGQGDTTVTPLQLASVYAAVANGGHVLTPTIGRALLPADGRSVLQVPPKVRGTVPATPEALAYLRDSLAGVTEPGGTAAEAFAGFPQGQLAVAGKTGTGQVAGKQDTSWFASFAPAADPDLVVIGVISQGGTGATTAAPLVRDVYEGIYGLSGQPAALPGGRLPTDLPLVRADGSVAPPGARLDAPGRRTVAPVVSPIPPALDPRRTPVAP